MAERIAALIIHQRDNVAMAVAEEGLEKGRRIWAKGDGRTLELTPLENIPFGHKIALTDIPAGDEVVKYGYPIGKAVCKISAGGLVNHTNMGEREAGDGSEGGIA